MKKFYTIASALMLAMSMTMMTACSSENDPVIDEPVVPEQPTTRIVTLKATANMGAETRVAVEGIDGKEDAFRITGWKNDDVVKVLALKEDGSGAYNEISFTYNASTETFTGTVPPEFDLSELKYAYVGGSFRDAMPNPFTKEWDIIRIRTSIAISDPEDCFLFGNVSVDGESISANLSAPYALACVHNNTSADIEVGQIRNANDYFWGGLSYRYESTASSFKFGSGSTADASMAEKYTVPAGQKAYFVIPPKDEEGDIYYGLYDFTNEKVIAAPKESITPGKVYKVQVNSAPTTGTAKATIGSSEVDVNWVQLWAGGPKFAEYNVGVTDGKAESYGGYYCWGGSIDKDTEGAYNTGTVDLKDDADTATNLWGDKWRMPTRAELDDLLANCDVEWTTQNGVNGLLCTGTESYSSNSIFLPAAGYWISGDAVVALGGDVGFYWSSTAYEGDFEDGLLFNSESQEVGCDFRDGGNSVRAVLAE